MIKFSEDDSYYRVIQLIDTISANNRKHVEKQLRPLNMTYPQTGVLMYLHSKDGVSQRELADQCETDTTTMTVICDSLEKRGWVNRVTHENDRRIKKIYLTDKGKKAYSDAQEVLRSGLVYIHEKTSAEGLSKVQPFLEELNRNTRALYEGKFEKAVKESSNSLKI